MSNGNVINNEDFRMRIINLLKIYGYYDGILVVNGNDKAFVSGECLVDDIILSRGEFVKLKRSVNKVLDYCYLNSFDEIERVVNYFYEVVCKNVKKKYGNIVEKLF